MLAGTRLMETRNWLDSVLRAYRDVFAGRHKNKWTSNGNRYE